MPLESGLLEILACPACHAPLKEQSLAPRGVEDQQGKGVPQADDAPQESELRCTSKECGLAYPVRDGIPVLLVDEARRPA